MSAPDIRWQQRLYNFRRVLVQLDDAMALMVERPLSKLEMQGVIQGFEYCYELGWNTLKDFLVWQPVGWTTAQPCPPIRLGRGGQSLRELSTLRFHPD